MTATTAVDDSSSSAASSAIDDMASCSSGDGESNKNERVAEATMKTTTKLELKRRRSTGDTPPLQKTKTPTSGRRRASFSNRFHGRLPIINDIKNENKESNTAAAELECVGKQEGGTNKWPALGDREITTLEGHFAGHSSCLRTFVGHSREVTSVAFSPDNGQSVLTGSRDNTAKLWNANTGECLRIFGGHSGYFRIFEGHSG